MDVKQRDSLSRIDISITAKRSATCGNGRADIYASTRTRRQLA